MDDLKRQSSYSDAMEELVSYLCEVTKSEAFVKGKELAQNLHQSMEETKMIFSLQKIRLCGKKNQRAIFLQREWQRLLLSTKAGAGSECKQGDRAYAA